MGAADVIGFGGSVLIVIGEPGLQNLVIIDDAGQVMMIIRVFTSVFPGGGVRLGHYSQVWVPKSHLPVSCAAHFLNDHF